MHRKVRILLNMTLLMIFATIIVGSLPAQAKRTLRIGTQGWIVKKYNMVEAVKEFNKMHPDIDAKIIEFTMEEIEGFMLKWSRGETSYDIVIGPGLQHARPYQERNFVLPWDFVFEKVPEDEFLAPFLRLGRIKGKYYSLPWCGEVIALIYRTDMFRDAGLFVGPPRTWTDIAEYAKKLTVDNNNDGVVDVYGLAAPLVAAPSNKMDWVVWGTLESLGGELYDKDGNFNVKSEKYREALKFYVDLRKNGYLLPDCHVNDNVGRNAFKAGKVAMLVTWHSRLIEAQQVLGYEKASLSPLPGSVENGSFITTGGGIFLPRFGNIEDAKKFTFDVLLSDWFNNWAAAKYGKMPTIKSHFAKLEESYWDDLLKIADISSTMPLYVDAPKMFDIISRESVRALLGMKSVDEAMDAAYEEIKDLRK